MLLACFIGMPGQAVFAAAAQDAALSFRPHCIEGGAVASEKKGSWIFGPIPSPGMIIDTQHGDGGSNVACGAFDVQDAQTLKTTALREGDILDIDVIVNNPGSQKISHVRAWLSYDPAILDGQMLTISDGFPVVTPTEKDFYAEEGYAKIEASASDKVPADAVVAVARIQFKVKKTAPVGTPIGFHDAQPGGHTFVMTKEGSDESYILKEEPGVLLVTFQGSAAAGASSADAAAPVASAPSTATGVLSDNELAVAPPADFNPLGGAVSSAKAASGATTSSSAAKKTAAGGSCIQNQECETGLCIGGSCVQGGTVANGGACTVDEQCSSGLCGNNLCVASLGEKKLPADEVSPQRTAFGLLQVQNLRITTEGSSVFLAWDNLRSSALQSYNIYYGTTSGRYIQRKTIAKEENSIRIRSLPTGAVYYFAVRAVNVQSEESAFSREVSVTVGNPSTATMPLNLETTTPAPTNPLEGSVTQNHNDALPGQTGISSFMAAILLASAVAGTLLASRRQMVVTPMSSL